MDEILPTKINQWKTLDKDSRQDRPPRGRRRGDRAAEGGDRPFGDLHPDLRLRRRRLRSDSGPGTLTIVVAAAFGAYMALNIGANDVANNMAPPLARTR